MKRVALFMCIVLTFIFLTSCSSDVNSLNESSNEITNSEVVSNQSDSLIFSLGYFSNDSLNPYSASQSINFQLNTLIYDPLFFINENFDAVPVIADNFSFNENTCVVKIKEGLKFSDGTDLTVDDVIKSFESAKNSSYYSSRFSDVLSYKKNQNSIEFNLSNSDKNFVKNLCFPIIKAGSKQSGAIGSGRYKFSEESSPLKLVKNDYSVRKISGDISEISLVEIHKYSTLPYMIKIGSVNIAYISPDLDLKIAANKTNKVYTNNLVYLGINSANKYLQNPDFRKAVSLIINRKGILTDAYASAGFETALPFHPKAASYNSSYKIDTTNVLAATELLTILGYTEKNKENFLKDGEEEVSLKLVVNKDNASRFRAAESIKINLEAAGIRVNIIEETTEGYMAKIASGDYDLFIGETKLSPSNDISRLLSVGAFNRCDDLGETLMYYNQYRIGQISLDDFLRNFDLKTPFIPILYRNSMSICSGTLKIEEALVEYDVFGNMQKWEFN